MNFICLFGSYTFCEPKKIHESTKVYKSKSIDKTVIFTAQRSTIISCENWNRREPPLQASFST